ncbi:MAG: trypsin-like serine protease [Myxococcota bacterium]
MPITAALVLPQFLLISQLPLADFTDNGDNDWRYLGLAQFTTTMEVHTSTYTPAVIPTDREGLADDFKMTLLADGHEYEMKGKNYIVTDIMLAHQNAGEVAYTSASDEPYGDETDDPLKVFGTDTRTPRRNNTSYPFSALLTKPFGSCSGTLVSGNVALTAGHCVFNSDSKRWLTNSWAPGPDSRDSDQTPFGVYSSCAYIYVPSKRRNGDSHVHHDFAIIDFSRCTAGDAPNPGVTTGFHGMWDAPNSGIQNNYLHVYGTPSTDCPPAGCFYPTIYGTSNNSGWVKNSREVGHRTDTSSGQSGSGVYRIFSSTTNRRRYVVGIHKGFTWDLFQGFSHNYGRKVNTSVILFSYFMPMWINGTTTGLPQIQWLGLSATPPSSQ